MGYRRTAEFHELFIAPRWRRCAPLLVDRWGALSREAIVADIGAGTGVGLLAVAAITPARLVAVEPDLTMRTALMARLATDTALALRTTVLPDRVPQAVDQLPDLLDGAVVAHMLGHLTDRDRSELWSRLLPRLRPGAAAMVTVSPDPDPAHPTGDEPPVAESRRVGEREYTVSYGPHPVHGPGRGHLTIYRVHEHGRLVIEEIEISEWHPVTTADLRAEVAAAGGTVQETGDPAWCAVLPR